LGKRAGEIIFFTNFAENLSIMKKFFFNRAIKKYIRKNNRNKQFVNFYGAKSILLLYECGATKNRAVQKIIFQLSSLGKEVFTVGFIKGQDTEEFATHKMELIGKKDVNFLEMPNRSILKKLANSHFDLLIDLTATENLTMLYVALFADASMKASSHTTNSGIFDFILDISKLNESKKAESISNFEQFLFEEITFYLKTIQTFEEPTQEINSKFKVQSSKFKAEATEAKAEQATEKNQETKQDINSKFKVQSSKFKAEEKEKEKTKVKEKKAEEKEKVEIKKQEPKSKPKQDSKTNIKDTKVKTEKKEKAEAKKKEPKTKSQKPRQETNSKFKVQNSKFKVSGRGRTARHW